MFGILLVGVYSAYKHFSGLDPLKLDPQAIIKSAVSAKTPQEFLAVISSVKLPQGLSQIQSAVVENQVLGEQLGVKNITHKPSAPVLFRFLLVADSHTDNTNLEKAISQARQTYPDLSFIIGLGDYTDVGTISELKEAKSVFDVANLRYFLIAGDHDLWDSRDKGEDPSANFKQVFGVLYQSFIFNNFKFLLLDNSDNYVGLGPDQKEWIGKELDKEKVQGLSGVFVFIHEPLFHPSSDHFMGKVEKDVKMQAEGLTYKLKEANVRQVFSGDTHYFSQYEEPVTKTSMITVGALTSQRNPQVPRYSVVSVFEDGSTGVEDVELR